MPDYKDWIRELDIKVDYFSAFMKAWIAFNSWYRSSYGTGTDKEIIDKIKNTDNHFRDYMANMLASQDSEGRSFQESVAMLHGSLCNAIIYTQENGGTREQISFSKIAFRNTNRDSSHDYRLSHYSAKRTGATFKTEVKQRAGTKVYFSFEQDTYSFEELSHQTDFQRLSSEQQQQCILCYGEIQPYNIESILYSGDDAKKMGAYGFVNDNNKISKAIIEVLYLLRCSLAHGDVSPDESSGEVYRYAYEVLTATLKKLL